MAIFGRANNTILSSRALYLTHNTYKISRFEFTFTLNHCFVDPDQKIQVRLAYPAAIYALAPAAHGTARRSC